jgi:ferrous iron transport protein A
MTVAEMELNEGAEIRGVSGRGALAQRLLAMGFLPGTAVRVVQVAPFGDPLTVELDGWRVSLRRAEAAALEVGPVAAPGARA